LASAAWATPHTRLVTRQRWINIKGAGSVQLFDAGGLDL
jgi:hypothetical protein